MKLVIKGKDKNTGEVQEYAEFKSTNKDSAQYYLAKLVELFSRGYDFWVENQPGVTKTIKSYKTKKGDQNEYRSK